MRSKQNHNIKQVESQLIERCPIFVEILNTLETVDTVAFETAGQVKNVVELFCDYIGQVLQTGEVGRAETKGSTKVKELQQRLEASVKKTLGEIPLMVCVFARP